MLSTTVLIMLPSMASRSYTFHEKVESTPPTAWRGSQAEVSNINADNPRARPPTVSDISTDGSSTA
jgi:hypothetical protein